MRVVIDTNVIIASIGKISPSRLLFDSILNGKLDLFLTNDIFLEYTEILSDKTNIEVASNFALLLSSLENVHLIQIHYKWNLILEDPDDNKFIDCYISSNADFLITNDKHFEKIKNLEFPNVKIISMENFISTFLI